MAALQLPDFKLERYFARWEFAAPYVLCSSDVEGYRLDDLLALMDDESRHLWNTLSLGYTEAPGHPLLRTEIAALYEGVVADEILTFAGAEEAIFVVMNVLLGRGDHAIVTWPGYQSLYEVARSTGADVTLLPLEPEREWALDLDRLRRSIRPTTRLIVVNFPHNPTGALPHRATFMELVEIAREADAHLFSDEVYRFLEYEAADRLPAAVDLYERAISLGVMSKAFALAGLRIGWIATHDTSLLTRAAAFKDYTSICNSAPSEILALVGLRAREAVLRRSLDIIDQNLRHLDHFFARWSDILEWVRPRAGSIAFPRLAADLPVARFAEELVAEEGVLLLPGTLYDHPGNHFRIGFGRTNLPVAIERLDHFMARRFST